MSNYAKPGPDVIIMRQFKSNFKSKKRVGNYIFTQKTADKFRIQLQKLQIICFFKETLSDKLQFYLMISNINKHLKFSTLETYVFLSNTLISISRLID